MAHAAPLRTVSSWLSSFAVLVVFQLIGTAVVTATGINLPGPVVGLVLLGVALIVGRRGRSWRRRHVEPAADSLLEMLPLLFVPAGVGVVSYLPLLNQYLVAVVVALIASFVLTLIGTGGLLQLLLNRAGTRT